MKDNYGIKDDYIVNPPFDYDTKDLANSNYWTNKQIHRNYYTAYYVYKAANRIIKNLDNPSVLDIGCGAAIKLKRLISSYSKQITCMDSFGVEKICKQIIPDANFIPINFEKVNVNTVSRKYFDLIICSEVIEHLSDPDVILDLIKKSSNENSIILISTPERDSTRGKVANMSPNIHHVREWNSYEFKAYLESRGFKIQTHKTISPIKPHLSFYYLKQCFGSLLTLRPYIFSGTQLVICQY